MSPVPGDPAASGVALRAAYAAVTGASPADPVLLKLEPGTFDIGNAPLNLDKFDVHLEGSDRDLTTITGSGFVVLLVSADVHVSRASVTNAAGDGITVLSGRFELQEMRVSSTRDSDSAFASALSYIFSAHGRMQDVIVEATNNSGYAQGLIVSSSDPELVVLNGVVVKATAGLFARGMQVGSPVVMNDVRIGSSWSGLEVIATGPVAPILTIMNSRIDGFNNGLVSGSSGTSTITVQGSSIIGGVVSVQLDFSTADMKIAHTLLGGAVVSAATNTLTCFGAYDAALQPLDAACQPQAPIAGR